MAVVAGNGRGNSDIGWSKWELDENMSRAPHDADFYDYNWMRLLAGQTVKVAFIRPDEKKGVAVIVEPFFELGNCGISVPRKREGGDNRQRKSERGGYRKKSVGSRDK